MSRCINAKVDECQGGQMSKWTTGFLEVCRVDECRTAECQVDECLGTCVAV